MKRDMALVRTILLDAWNTESDSVLIDESSMGGNYLSHVFMLAGEGLLMLIKRVVSNGGHEQRFDLTWTGHTFAELAQDEKIYKTTIAETMKLSSVFSLRDIIIAMDVVRLGKDLAAEFSKKS